MKPPFLGMDPYLEGHLWHDMHNTLASHIRRQLNQVLPARYTALINVYFVNDQVPADEVGIVYPDAEVVQPTPLLDAPGGVVTLPATTPPTAEIPATVPLEVRLPFIEVRDVENNRLVTAIEILSPTNKRQPGLDQYQRKRSELTRAGVHLVEIDLLRRGGRSWLPVSEGVPESPYAVFVTRIGQGSTAVWAVELSERLPVVPVPLRQPEREVPLDLQAAFASVYDEASYQRILKYKNSPPPPAFSDDDLAWIDEQLRAAGLRT